MKKYYDIVRENGFCGIRWFADDEKVEAGADCRKSYDWDYENDCSSYDTDNPVELDGTCSIGVYIDEDDTNEEIDKKISDAINTHCYFGTVAIITGDGYVYGADPDEIIVESAYILEVA